MRKPIQAASITAAIGALLYAASAGAQEAGLNRVADGDFENGIVGLSLPPDALFPMFSGGWAARGMRLPEIVVAAAFEGRHAMRIVSRPADPLLIAQDLPLSGSGYGLRIAFFIEEGTQSVRLLGAWDRGIPDRGDTAFEARISSAGIGFTTPAGIWRTDAALAPRTWHTLSVIADPRTGVNSVRLDGRPLIVLPGVAGRPPMTLAIGGGGADSGVFRYDAVEVVSLVDLELAAIRDAAARLESATGAAVLDRLAAARAALLRGSAALAVPELGVARGLLAAAAETEDLARAVDELIALIRAGDERRRDPLSSIFDAGGLLDAGDLFDAGGGPLDAGGLFDGAGVSSGGLGTR